MSFDYAFFYDSNNGDRTYNAECFEQWLKKFFTSGVFTGDLLVMKGARSYDIDVSPGYCNVDGKVRFFDSWSTLTLNVPDSSLNRIDSIVIERNDTDRNITLKAVTGIPSTSPAAPTPIRSGGVYQLVLAQIQVRAGIVAIAHSDIRDVRENTELCGVVASTVKELDATHLRYQFDALCATCEEEFSEWFANLQDQLSTDAAGNLQVQLNTERARIDTLVAQKSNEVVEGTELTFTGTKTTCESIYAVSNGICAELYISKLLWTENTLGTWDDIAVFPEALKPLTQSAPGNGTRQVIYDTDDIQIQLRDERLQVYRKKTGTPTSHTCMVAYALKNPVMSELSDLRNGADGNVYESAGEAIRAQIRNIEGFDAVVDVATKMDTKNAVGSGSFSIGRKSGTTVGSASATLGASNTASGNWSTASGYGNTASAQCSSAMGMNNVASGQQSAAMGSGNEASGYESFACNSKNKASGNCSFAAGNFNEALTHQMAIGHYNDISLALENSKTGTSDGTAFVIGNGTSAAKSNAFRVTGKGDVIGKSAYQATGADMAELREWLDGNPDNEDRRGYFVTMDGLNIKIAEPGDFICGIISANPCLIGNADEDWVGRYVFDEFGAFVYETVEEIDLETGETVTCEGYKMNPEYDPTREYVRRQDRPEWDYVGLTGVISVRDDGTCEVNGFCKCGDGGIATKSDRGYRVVERVNQNIIKVLFYLTCESF